MNETLTESTLENSESEKCTSELYAELLKLEPKPVSSTVPENGAEQKQAFLDGAIRNPQHEYPKLKALSRDDIDALIEVGVRLVESVDSPVEKQVYQEFVDSQIATYELMLAMNDVRLAETDEDRQAARSRFMEINIEKYGEPDKETYESLLTEKAMDALTKPTTGRAAQIQAELAEFLPENIVENLKKGHIPERFQPSPETVEWVSDLTEVLYGGLLKHIPEKDSFNSEEICKIFQEILDEEFGDAAKGWTVVLKKAKSINVDAAAKEIIVPEDIQDMSRTKIRELVVHEIGVHVLGAITGGSTNIGPLGNGLSDYGPAEEGAGTAMQLGLRKTFKEAGIDHYITAGTAYHGQMDFRDIYEMKWRISAVLGADDSGEVSDEKIDKSKDAAYGNALRTYRGADELPWFKDLRYYNGGVEIWKFFEKIKGDDFLFTLFMQGKINTSKEHMRIVLESETVNFDNSTW